MKTRLLPFLGIALLTIAACSGGDDGTDDINPTGSFTVTTFPASTEAAMATVSGTKAKGTGVYVNGAERIPADAAPNWSVQVALDPGQNVFRFQPVSANGDLGQVVTITITRGANDTTPPTVTSISPADMATDVSLNQQVVVTFSEAIDCTSVQNTTVIVSSGGAIAGQVACANAGATGSINFTPGANLPAMAAHTVTVLAEVKDVAGNTLAAPYMSTFTTGATVDVTPPVDPTITAPSPIPGMTFDASITVMGTKEANANVEARWELDGTQQNDFAVAVGIDANGTWTHVFPLLNGTNVYTLRSADGAGNLSCDGNCTVTFTILKEQNVMMVDPPTVQFIGNTSAAQQVIVGTKGAGHGIEIDGSLVVPRGPETNWDFELNLNNGANTFDVRAQDSSGNQSSIVPVAITYTPGAPAPSGGELRVELELRDMWNFVGDEFRMNQCTVEVNAYEVLIWLEGPLALDDNGTPGNPNDDRVEPCAFDAPNFQRKYTRYVNTVTRALEENQFPLWHYRNYAVPNWFAALVESGHWANAPAAIPTNVDRRDGNGNAIWSRDPPCAPFFTFRDGRCEHNALAPGAPVIDGITHATLHGPYNRNTGTYQDGSQLGTWSGRYSFDWDLRDTNGQLVDQGAYLVNVMVVLDRSEESEQAPGGITDDGSAAVAPYQFFDVLNTDQETCWDNAAHDTVGAHRAEGIIVIDGQGKTAFWDEKGQPETVDGPHNPREGIRFDGRCDWDGVPDAFCQPNSNPDTLNGNPGCPPPNTALGQQVKYLNTPGGWAAPVRVEYCPGGCP